MMERKSFKEPDEECTGSYRISSCSQNRASGVPFPITPRIFEIEDTGSSSSVVGSTDLEPNIMQTSTKSIPPVATISPRIKMR